MEFDFEESLEVPQEAPPSLPAAGAGAPVAGGPPQASSFGGNFSGGAQFSSSGASGQHGVTHTSAGASSSSSGMAAAGRRRKRDRVCMYWIRGGCMKGDACDFLHEDNPDKMPECQHGLNCRNRDCKFLHTGAEESMRVGTDICPDFAAGFCPLGQSCRMRHHTKPAEQRPHVAREYTAQSRAAEVNRQRGVKVLPDYHTLTQGAHGRSHDETPRVGEPGDRQFMKGGALQELALGQGVVSRRGAEACVTQPWAPCATLPDARSLEMPWRTYGARLGCPDATLPGGGAHGRSGDASSQSFYFVVKVADSATLMRSVRQGAWACTSEHAARVNRALRIMDHPPGSPGAPRVFLFFSVVGSRYFQGVAQVTSGIRDARQEPCLFGVQWHRTVKLPFSMCANLVSEPAMHERIVRSKNFQPLPSVLGHSLMLMVFLRPALQIDLDGASSSSGVGGLAEEQVQEPWVLVDDSELENEEVGPSIPPDGTALPPMSSREQGRLMKRVEVIAGGGDAAHREAKAWRKEAAARKKRDPEEAAGDQGAGPARKPDLVAHAIRHSRAAQALVSLGVSPGPWVPFQSLSPPVVLPLLPAATQQHGGAVEAAAAEWVHGGEGPAPPSLPGVEPLAPGDLPQQAVGAAGAADEDSQSAVDLLTQSQATHVSVVAPRCGSACAGVLVVGLPTTELQGALKLGRLRITAGALLAAVQEQAGKSQLAGLPLLLVDLGSDTVLGLFAVASRAEGAGAGPGGALEVDFVCVAECPPMKVDEALSTAGVPSLGGIGIGIGMGRGDVGEGEGAGLGEWEGASEQSGGWLEPGPARGLSSKMLAGWPLPMALALVLVQRQAKLAWKRAGAGDGEQILRANEDGGEDKHEDEDEDEEDDAGPADGTSAGAVHSEDAPPGDDDRARGGDAGDGPVATASDSPQEGAGDKQESGDGGGAGAEHQEEMES